MSNVFRVAMLNLEGAPSKHQFFGRKAALSDFDRTRMLTMPKDNGLSLFTVGFGATAHVVLRCSSALAPAQPLEAPGQMVFQMQPSRRKALHHLRRDCVWLLSGSAASLPSGFCEAAINVDLTRLSATAPVTGKCLHFRVPIKELVLQVDSKPGLMREIIIPGLSSVGNATEATPRLPFSPQNKKVTNPQPPQHNAPKPRARQSSM